MPNKVVPGNKPGNHIVIHFPKDAVAVNIRPLPKNNKKNIKTRKNRNVYRRSRRNRK
jgi:hypothetical protein